MAPLQSNWAISKRKDNQNTSWSTVTICPPRTFAKRLRNSCQMASRKKSKNISCKPELPNRISFTTSFCSYFRMIFTFAFRKTLIESKYKHVLPPHRRASRHARITRLTDFDWHSHSRSQSVFPVHQRTDYSKIKKVVLHDPTFRASFRATALR